MLPVSNVAVGADGTAKRRESEFFCRLYKVTCCWNRVLKFAAWIGVLIPCKVDAVFFVMANPAVRKFEMWVVPELLIVVEAIQPDVEFQIWAFKSVLCCRQ